MRRVDLMTLFVFAVLCACGDDDEPVTPPCWELSDAACFTEANGERIDVRCLEQRCCQLVAMVFACDDGGCSSDERVMIEASLEGECHFTEQAPGNDINPCLNACDPSTP